MPDYILLIYGSTLGQIVFPTSVPRDIYIGFVFYNRYVTATADSHMASNPIIKQYLDKYKNWLDEKHG